MGYRGGDLDLRTPRTWSSSAPESAAQSNYEPRPRASYPAGPIWVDEVVLACVNHAYDVALAHRAAEVRLEHLLHALTRIDAAAEVLEIRGIRAVALRRETATAIASEIPVGLSGGDVGPRHSEELEHVLRAASLIASRRNAPASVDDLLHLMLDVEPDLPGLGILARVDMRFSVGNGSYARQPRGQKVQAAPAAAAAHQASREAPRLSRPDFTTTVVDNAQNVRLDALEQMMRSLSADLVSERQGLANLLGDLQRDLPGLRGHQSDFGPMSDRVASIERSVTAGFEQFSLALASIENDLRSRSHATVDLSPITSRLEIIEEALLSRDGEKAIREVSERLDRLETTLAGERTRSAESGALLIGEVGQLARSVDAYRTETAALLPPMQERVQEVRSAVEASELKAAERLQALSDRISSVEKLVADTLQKLIEGQEAARADLSEVSDAIVKLNVNQHTLAGSIEQNRNDSREHVATVRDEIRLAAASLTGSYDAIVPRLALIEGETQRVGGAVEGLTGTVENMHRVTVERYYRRNRFWYWLFGTDDWVAASWPSQSHRIAEELKAVKAVRR